jgi:hypothetical protein
MADEGSEMSEKIEPALSAEGWVDLRAVRAARARDGRDNATAMGVIGACAYTADEAVAVANDLLPDSDPQGT